MQFHLPIKQTSLKGLFAVGATSSASSPCGSTGSSSTPTCEAKKRRIHVTKGQPEHMRTGEHKFQPHSQEGRPWLRHDAGNGMWCESCHRFWEHKVVARPPTRRNALLYPSTYCSFRNMKNHDTSFYHLAGVALKNQLYTPVCGLPILLPSALVPQVKVMFPLYYTWPGMMLQVANSGYC